MVWPNAKEGYWIYWLKDVQCGAGGKAEDHVHGCREGGHGKGGNGGR